MSNLNTNGDALERAYSDFITTHIPYYENIWSIFIGNDGTAHLAPMENETSDIREKRQNIGEINYSILESLISMYKINKKYQSLKISDIHHIVEANDDLILFLTRIGNIRDLVSSCKEILNNTSPDKLNNYYQKRNSIVHGRRIPYSLNTDAELIIPEIDVASSKNSHNKIGTWYDRNFGHSNWTNFPSMNQISLKDFFNETLTQLYPILNLEFALILEEVKKLIKSNNLTIKPIHPVNISGSTPPTFSVSTFEHFSSGNSGTLQD